MCCGFLPSEEVLNKTIVKFYLKNIKKFKFEKIKQERKISNESASFFSCGSVTKNKKIKGEVNITKNTKVHILTRRCCL